MLKRWYLTLFNQGGDIQCAVKPWKGLTFGLRSNS